MHEDPREWRVEEAIEPGDLLDAATAAAGSPSCDARLQAVATLKDRLPDLERDAVHHALSMGSSWAQIAASLGVTRQAIFKKYGPSALDPPAPRPTRATVDRRIAARKSREMLEKAAEEYFARVRKT